MLHTLLLYLLFAMKWMTVELVDYGPPLSCCRATSTKTVPVENIVKFSYQVGCHVEAIKFLTKKGKYICSDPESAWAKETIDQLTRKPPILPLPPTWTTPSTTTPTTPATTERTTSPKATTPAVPTAKLPTSTENQMPKVTPTITINQTTKSTHDLPIPTTRTTSITQSPSTTEEPAPSTTIPPQQQTTTPRTTKMTSSEAPVTTQPLQFESTASTVITTTTLTMSTVTTAGPQQTTSPPVQQTDSTAVNIPTTHPHPTRTLTKEQQNPIFHKEPWTDRRLKKKKRSGLRKAQRKLSG